MSERAVAESYFTSLKDALKDPEPTAVAGILEPAGHRRLRMVRPAGQRTGHIMSSATYRTLLRAPGAAAFFLTAAAGRVGIAMTSLGIVWLVHARTGSYITAGLVTGGFAVAEAAAGPQLARLADCFGQTRVLPAALLAHAVAVAALLALVAASAPDWLMTTGGIVAGATIPQLGALSAARWAALLRDERAASITFPRALVRRFTSRFRGNAPTAAKRVAKESAGRTRDRAPAGLQRAVRLRWQMAGVSANLM